MPLNVSLQNQLATKMAHNTQNDGKNFSGGSRWNTQNIASILTCFVSWGFFWLEQTWNRGMYKQIQNCDQFASSKQYVAVMHYLKKRMCVWKKNPIDSTEETKLDFWIAWKLEQKNFGNKPKRFFEWKSNFLTYKIFFRSFVATFPVVHSVWKWTNIFVQPCMYYNLVCSISDHLQFRVLTDVVCHVVTH